MVEAEWAEFDLNAAIWRIPAEQMKKRKEHVVPLPTQAVKQLRSMHTITGDKKHLFPHRDNRTKPMVIGLIPADAQYPRLVGQIQPSRDQNDRQYPTERNSINSDWIERQLAHTEPNSARRSYNHADYLKQRTEMMLQ